MRYCKFGARLHLLLLLLLLSRTVTIGKLCITGSKLPPIPFIFHKYNYTEITGGKLMHHKGYRDKISRLDRQSVTLSDFHCICVSGL